MSKTQFGFFERLSARFTTGLVLKVLSSEDVPKKIRMLDSHSIVFEQMADGVVPLDRDRVVQDLKFFDDCIENIEEFYGDDQDVWDLSLSLIGAIAMAKRALGGSLESSLDESRKSIQDRIKRIENWESKYVLSEPDDLPVRVVKQPG